MTDDELEPARRLRGMPWLPWRILEGRQVPGPRTPLDNPPEGSETDDEL